MQIQNKNTNTNNPGRRASTKGEATATETRFEIIATLAAAR